MTNHWVDIKNANVVVVMGGNAAEAHPVGFRWAMEAKNNNDATLIVVDPRFTRTASVADIYAPIRSGTDITFLSGVLLYLIENNKINVEYVKHYTNAGLLVREDFAFEDGLFSGYDVGKRQYDKSSWNYQFDENGYAKRDETLSDPRCVWNLLKQHVSRYTPDVVENICGTPKADFLKVCEVLASTSAADRTTTFLYALGWTQHTVGAQNIRTMAMIQLLLGNMGMAGGGVNALRGHSNIQGLTDLGLLSTSLPGYLTLPSEKQTDWQRWLDANTPKATRPDQVNYWSNYPKFAVSLMKSFYGDAAQKENDWGFEWLPKWDQAYDVIKYFNMMDKGDVTGYICQGFNPVASFPDKNKVVRSLSKLKYMVVIDPLVTETSTFWQNHGESNDVDPAAIQTEVFRLPSTCFAEEDGSIANSGRWLQWHWKGQDAPGEARNDGEILAGIYHRLREMYRAEGGKDREDDQHRGRSEQRHRLHEVAAQDRVERRFAAGRVRHPAPPLPRHDARERRRPGEHRRRHPASRGGTLPDPRRRRRLRRLSGAIGAHAQQGGVGAFACPAGQRGALPRTYGKTTSPATSSPKQKTRHRRKRCRASQYRGSAPYLTRPR